MFGLVVDQQERARGAFLVLLLFAFGVLCARRVVEKTDDGGATALVVFIIVANSTTVVDFPGYCSHIGSSQPVLLFVRQSRRKFIYRSKESRAVVLVLVVLVCSIHVGYLRPCDCLRPAGVANIKGI